MMAEDTSGDVENPADPNPPPAATTPPSKNPHGGANPNDPKKKTKVILLSTFLLVVVVLAIALGVTLGTDATDSSNENAKTVEEIGEQSSDMTTTTTAATTLSTPTSATPASTDAPPKEEEGLEAATCLVGDIVYSEGDSIGHIGLECINATSYDGTASTCGPDGEIVETEKQFTCSESVPFCVQCGPRGWGAALCLSTETTDRDCGEQSSDTTTTTAATTLSTLTSATPASTNTPLNEEEDTTAPQVYKSQYLRSIGPIEAEVKIIDSTVANGYESCDDLREDILNALKYYANSIIVQQSEDSWNDRYEKCECGSTDPNQPWWCGGGYQYEYDGEVMYSMAPGAEMAMESPDTGSDGSAAKEKEDSFDTNNQVEGVDEADIAKSDGKYVYAAYGDVIYVWNATDGTQGNSITKMPQDGNDTNCPDYYSRPEEKPMLILVDEEAEMSTEEVKKPQVSEATASSTSSSNSGGKRNRRDRRTKARSSIWWDPCYVSKPQVLSLLLEGTRLTAIVSEDNYRHYSRYDIDDELDPIIDDYTKLFIRVYDVSDVPMDGSPLTLLAEKEIEGSFNSARSVNNTGFIISTSYINLWQFQTDLQRDQPQYCGLNTTEYVKLAAETALNNTAPFMERMVKELQLEQDDGNTTCKNIFQVAAMQGGDSNEDNTDDGNLLSQFVQVLSFDMSVEYKDQVIPTDVAGAFSTGWLHSVYASQKFAATVNVGSSYNKTSGNWEQSSFILGFDISDTEAGPEPFCYAEIRGRPLNQYSLDLFEGHLRVVTEENLGWGDIPSRTLNKLFILKVPEAGEGQEMALTADTGHIGKPNESVTSVRFIKDRAYIVTFERTDPFYIFNLTDPTSPYKLGELQIPGYSSYLHPIEIDGVPLMLGIGEHADDNGRTTGIKISLFDISDPTDPTENATLIDEGAYSSAGNDYKSFRYLAVSQKLILPKSEWRWSSSGNFDGFAVYDVSVDEIAPTYEIQHASSYDMYYHCWYNAYMPARSFVFQSKLTTILSHSVISTDLETGEGLWNMSLDEGLNNTRCAPYFHRGW